MKVLNSLYDKNLEEILGGNTPGGNPPGVFYPTTMAEFKTALEDQSFTDKFIYCTSPISVDSNLSISAMGFNFLVFGVSFRASGDYTITFSQPADSYTVINSARGIGLQTTNFSFTRNISFVSTNDTYMTINTGTLYQSKVNLTVTGLSFRYEKLSQTSSTLTGDIAQAIVNTTTPDAKTTSSGLMSGSDKSRLDNIYNKVRKPTTFVIGNTTAGHTTDICDYLCDGTADEVEINAAITALPATGGEILILDGTYNIASTINLNKINSTLRGVGSSTILKRSATGFSLLNINNTNCIVSNLQIDGGGGTYAGSTNHGIFITSENAKVLFCTVKYSDGADIYASGSNALIKGNIIDLMYLYGSNGAVTNNRIRYFTCNATTSVSSWVITFNYIDNDFALTKIYYSSISNNIFTTYGSNGIYITGDYNVISNNSIKGKTSQGIFLSGNCNNISSNILINNAIGIELTGSSKNTIIGNLIIKGTGLASDYSGSQHTIFLSNTSCNNNFITNNSCMGKDVVITAGCTGNTIKDNKIGGETGKYTTTIATGDWAGSSAPYIAMKTITGLLATDRPHITVDYNATLATALLEKKAYACIDEVEVTANDTIVFRCFETKPTQVLNIIVEVY